MSVPQRSSKYLLGYTVDSEISGNELFPNPFKGNGDQGSVHSQDNIFKRKSLLKDNTYNEDEEIEYDTDDRYTTDEDIGSEVDVTEQRNAFKSNFDTDSENDAYTIQTSILNEMTDDTINKDDSSGRFKFFSTYTKLFKNRNKEQKRQEELSIVNGDIPLQSMDSKNSSVFNLRNLDDFNKYVKMTEINNSIINKLDKIKPQENNLLEIVPSKDLERNFYIDANDVATDSRSHSNRKWFRDRKRPDATTTIKNADVYSREGSPFSSSIDERIPNRYLSRSLKVRNLQMISFGGTLGVGLFLNSGKAFTIAGGFGTLLAFVLCGIVVLTTIISFCEMVTFVSIVDGVSGLSSRFVDDAFGFSVGWLYFLSFAFGLAGEIVASVIMLTYYPDLKLLDNKGSIAGFVTLFFVTVVISNSISVQVFGEIEYISSLVKLIFILIMIILMIALNRGGFGGDVLGFKYWMYSKSDFEHNVIFGLFRPSFNLQDTGTSDPTEGIGGNLGRFMSLLVAISVISFAYSGTEIVCIAACEAKDPRKALPSATKRVFWRIMIFYCLSAFVVSLNLYAGDPRLLRYFSGSTGVAIPDLSSNYAVKYVGGSHCKSDSAVFAGYSSGSQSPWIVAFQSANLCNLSGAVNGFLVFFAVSCGNAQLYVSSRTMYSLALQGKAPRIFSTCNRYGIPYYSVAFAALFGLFSYICVSEEATVVFQNLSNIIASSGIIVWFAMCLSYIRFYYGLKKRPDIISRDDPSYPYKSFFQPYSAFIGLIGSAVIILTMGYTVFLKGCWDTLAFFSSYGTLILFAICYVVYRFIYGSRMKSLETLDFDTGRREMDRYIWDGSKDYNRRNVKEVLHKWVSFLA